MGAKFCKGTTVEGRGGATGRCADDEALRPQRYNRLHCLTVAAQITFSSLCVYFPHPCWSVLVTTPSLTNQPSCPPSGKVLKSDTYKVLIVFWVEGWRCLFFLN